MTTPRYCKDCRTEVDSVDGFCRLGHSVERFDVPAGSLTELRAEVDAAFDDALRRVAEVAAPPLQDPAPATPVRSAPPPPPPPDWTPRSLSSAPEAPRPPAPAAPAAPTAPAAPAAQTDAPASAAPQVYSELGSDLPGGPDPITAFAPPPSMDWGPSESASRKFLRKLPQRANPLEPAPTTR